MGRTEVEAGRFRGAVCKIIPCPKILTDGNAGTGVLNRLPLEDLNH